MLAPDPGALAADGIMTNEFISAKRLRCSLVTSQGTAAEIEASALLVHKIEHRELGAVAVGNLTPPFLMTYLNYMCNSKL